MRIVAIEEHFSIPAMQGRISKEALMARGIPQGKPPPAVARGDLLREVGQPRIGDMDAAGITVQVLSAGGAGAELLPPGEGPAYAREINDSLARIVAEHPGRYHGFTHLPMTAPEAAADELVTGDALREGLRQAARRPFRVVPFFDPGPWGGQWMRQVCALPDGPPNYAWCFDCVPEENSLLLGFGDITVEIPAIDLVFFQPEAEKSRCASRNVSWTTSEAPPLAWSFASSSRPAIPSR